MRFEPSVHSPTTYGDAASEAKRLPVLRQGATDAQTGNAVSRAINALIRSGIPVAGLKTPITPGRASYGPKVVADVKGFQSSYGLFPADGIVGPKTWAALLALEADAADVVIPANTTPLLPAGSAPAGAAPAAPPEEIKLPDGTTVSRVPQSAWRTFREGKWFWPAVGGTALGGVVLIGWLVYAARSKKSV